MAENQVDYKKLSDIVEKNERKYLMVEMVFDHFKKRSEENSKTSFFDVFRPSKWKQAGLNISSQNNTAPLAKLLSILVPKESLVRGEKENYRIELERNLSENEKKSREKLDKEFEAKKRAIERALNDNKISAERRDELHQDLKTWYENAKKQLKEEVVAISNEMSGIIEKYGIKLMETGKQDESEKAAESGMEDIRKGLNEIADIENNFYKAITENQTIKEFEAPKNNFVEGFRQLMAEPPLETLIEKITAIPTIVEPRKDPFIEQQQADEVGHNKRTEQSLKEILENTQELVKITNQIAKVQKDRDGMGTTPSSGLSVFGNVVDKGKSLLGAVASAFVGGKLLTTIANKTKNIFTKTNNKSLTTVANGDKTSKTVVKSTNDNSKTVVTKGDTNKTTVSKTDTKSSTLSTNTENTTKSVSNDSKNVAKTTVNNADNANKTVIDKSNIDKTVVTEGDKTTKTSVSKTDNSKTVVAEGDKTTKTNVSNANNATKSTLSTKNESAVNNKSVDTKVDLPQSNQQTLSTTKPTTVSKFGRVARVGKSLLKGFAPLSLALGVAEGLKQVTDYNAKSNELDVKVSRGEITREQAEQMRHTYKMQAFVRSVSGVIPFVGDAVGDYISEKIEAETTVTDPSSGSKSVLEYKNPYKGDENKTLSGLTFKPTSDSSLVLNQPSINNFTVSEKGFGTDGQRLTTVTQDKSLSSNTSANRIVDASTKIINNSNVSTQTGSRDFFSRNLDQSLNPVRRNWKI